MSPSESLMWKLIEIVWSLEKFECVTDVESYMREDYSIVEAKDFSQYVLPSEIEIARKVRYVIISLILFARVIYKLPSINVAKSLIAAYLSPLSITREFTRVISIHILKNNK